MLWNGLWRISSNDQVINSRGIPPVYYLFLLRLVKHLVSNSRPVPDMCTHGPESNVMCSILIFSSNHAEPLTGTKAKLRLCVPELLQVKFLQEELGFDAAYNYKKTSHMEALEKLCPEGIDM